jgi:hypothetical protein
MGIGGAVVAAGCFGRILHKHPAARDKSVEVHDLAPVDRN